MTSSAMRGARRGIMLAATGIIMAAGPARAQDMDAPGPARAQLPPGAIVQPLDNGPGAELRRNLNALASNPRSLDALIGAGRAANAMGDGQAALGFFARADELSPNDARVKAGMGSALVQMERADQALTLFSQALALGAPELEIAGDRGLAYDMMGDPRRAQQDYALVLRRRGDPEVERRMALSLAISGQREAALSVIESQLRRDDRAAWRTQAFVLALTGDARGAEDTAARMMPAGNAQEMAPFFVRLASLSPAQKAAAVHFGRFPSDGRATRVASNVDTRADPDALALAEGPGVQPSRPRPQPAEPLNRAPRRRPGADEGPIATLIRTPRREEAPAVEPRRPVEVAQADTRRFAPPQPEPDPDAAKPDEDQVETEPDQPPAEAPREAPAFAPGASFTLEQGGDQPPPAPAETRPAPARARPAVQSARRTFARRSDFGDVTAVVQSLPDEEAAPEPSPARARRATTPPRSSPARARLASASGPQTRGRSSRNAPPANPTRYWVQLAHSGAQSVLPYEFVEARTAAPALLRGRVAYVALTNRINRLLVGPFDSAAAARAFIAQLERRHVEAIAWTSPAGQEIERLRIPNEPRSLRSQSEPPQGTAARGSRSARTEPAPRAATRGSASRSEHGQRSSTGASDSRSASQRRASSRDSSASAGRTAARTSRSRSGHEQRPPSRGRPSH